MHCAKYTLKSSKKTSLSQLFHNIKETYNNFDFHLKPKNYKPSQKSMGTNDLNTSCNFLLSIMISLISIVLNMIYMILLTRSLHSLMHYHVQTLEIDLVFSRNHVLFSI